MSRFGQITLCNSEHGGAMDWLGVVNQVRTQVARSGEALVPWSAIVQAANTMPRSAIAMQAAESPGVDPSPMGLLKQLAESEGNLEFTIDFSSKLVHLKKPMATSPGVG